MRIAFSQDPTSRPILDVWMTERQYNLMVLHVETAYPGLHGKPGNIFMMVQQNRAPIMLEYLVSQLGYEHNEPLRTYLGNLSESPGGSFELSRMLMRFHVARGPEVHIGPLRLGRGYDFNPEFLPDDHTTN